MIDSLIGDALIPDRFWPPAIQACREDLESASRSGAHHDTFAHRCDGYRALLTTASPMACKNVSDCARAYCQQGSVPSD